MREQKGNSGHNREKLFDIPVPGLLAALRERRRREYARKTVYNWVNQGMPHEKFRGELFFNLEESVTWLERTS